MTGAGGHEHWQPLRRARGGVVGLRQLACHTGLGHVRDEGGAEGGDDADEDECAGTRRGLLRLYDEVWESRRHVAGRGWRLAAKSSSWRMGSITPQSHKLPSREVSSGNRSSRGAARAFKASPAVAQPGDGALSLARPGQICIPASTLVALERAPPSGDIACAVISLVTSSLAAMLAAASAKQEAWPGEGVRGSSEGIRVTRGLPGSGWDRIKGQGQGSV